MFHFLFTLGSTLVSGSSDNTLRVWDVKTHQCVLILDSPHTDSVRCVQLQVCYDKYAASFRSILVVWCAMPFLSPCFMMLIGGYRNHGCLMLRDFFKLSWHLNNIVIHQTHYEKSDWLRAFNQFTITCELDMINVIYYMASSASGQYVTNSVF